jgi:hypothetical protein
VRIMVEHAIAEPEQWRSLQRWSSRRETPPEVMAANWRPGLGTGPPGVFPRGPSTVLVLAGLAARWRSGPIARRTHRKLNRAHPRWFQIPGLAERLAPRPTSGIRSSCTASASTRTLPGPGSCSGTEAGVRCQSGSGIDRVQGSGIGSGSGAGSGSGTGAGVRTGTGIGGRTGAGVGVGVGIRASRWACLGAGSWRLRGGCARVGGFSGWCVLGRLWFR